MLKILFYINTIGGGGAERVMTNLAKQFAESNCEVIFVTSFPVEREYPLDDRVQRYSLEEQEIKQSRILKNLTRIKKLRNLCKKHKPDVVIAFMAEPNFRAICATRGLPVKTIVSVRNDPNKEYAGKLGHFIGKRILPLADGCVFQTEDAMKWFPTQLQKKSRIIYNAVKPEFYRIEREPVPGRIVTCGRLTGQKNHAMLIDAFANVSKDYQDLHLHIYGSGELKDLLQKQIDSLGLQERVLLMGATNHVPEVLRTTDIFVLSSDYEGMPNALMEALATGVPSISTDCPCGGPRMLIENEKNGLLVPVGDQEAMENALRKMLSDRVFTEATGAEARRRAVEYLPEKIFEEWRGYIHQVLQKR